MAGRQQFLVVTISWTRLKTGAALIELWMIERCASETIANFQAIKGQVSARASVGSQVAVADRSMARRAEPSWNPVW
ncbi:hypothetical protein DFJ73DRAFT_852037 [Zopfochytrium polystomum]|nr:hypothetical protein DFJ73DRAFT_852037 [Zopfochytrium polystomum]